MNRLRLLWRMLRGTDSDDLNRHMEHVEQRLDLLEQLAAFRKVAHEPERAR